MSGPAFSPELRLVRDLARVLNSDLPAEEVLPRVVDLVRESTGAARVTLWRRVSGGSDPVPISAPRDAVLPPEEPLGGGGSGLRAEATHAGAHLGTLVLDPAPGGPPLSRELPALLADVLAPYLDSRVWAEDEADTVLARARELQLERRLTSLVIDSLPVGLYVVDRDYRIRMWNRSRESGNQGLRRDQVVGRRVFDVLTRQPAERLRAEFDHVFETGETVQWEQEVDIKGQRRTFRLSKIPMRLTGDAVTHVITIGEDVTERRLAEQQILQSEKLAAVGQLAAGVMHEINNPLATIGACAAEIAARLDQAADAAVREYLEIIETEVQRCTRIVDQLLEFSRPRRDRSAPAPTDLNRLVEQTLFLLKHHQRFKRLTVERALADGLPPVLVDGERVVQAFMAIMLNAVDAMERGGILRVRTLRNPQRPDELVTELEDTGIGIPPADLDRIFEPFYTTKPPGRGTGLGLTVTYGLIEEQGGRIAVESVPGEGTTFRVFLPVAPAAAEPEVPGSAASVPPPQEGR